MIWWLIQRVICAFRGHDVVLRLDLVEARCRHCGKSWSHKAGMP